MPRERRPLEDRFWEKVTVRGPNETQLVLANGGD